MSQAAPKRTARIGIDITAAVTQGAGIGRYTRELVAALVKGDASTSYALFSAKRPAHMPVAGAIPDGKHISYHEAPLSDRWLYRLWYRLNLPLGVQRFTGPLDLFHSPDFVLPPVTAGIPTLLTVHDLSFLHFPDTFTDSLVNYLNKVVPRSVTRATHVVADSEATRQDLIRAYSVPADKVTVLYAGVSNAFRPVDDDKKLTEIRAKYGLGDRPYILSVGTLQPRKNYQMLIRAYKRVAERSNHDLAIVGGKGWMVDRIVDEVERQELVGRVKLLGFADDADLPSLYSAAALFVYPSIYEGFGLPLLEAMACGVPVINSNASCLPEVAGDATLQLPPEDVDRWSEGMSGLLADSLTRSRMVAAGFLQARKFTWVRAARQLRSVYDMLLSE